MAFGRIALISGLAARRMILVKHLLNTLRRTPLKTLISTLLLTMGLSLQSIASEAPNFDSAMANYQKVVDESDTGALDLAHKEFQLLYDLDNSDPLALFYLGNTYTFKAKHTWMLWKKLSYLEKGLQQMDKAIVLLKPEHSERLVKGMPLDLKLKATAGAVFTQVPGFTNRFDQGQLYLKQVLNDERLESVPAKSKSYVYFYAAEAALEDNQKDYAKTLYQQVIKIDADSRYGTQSQAALAKL